MKLRLRMTIVVLAALVHATPVCAHTFKAAQLDDPVTDAQYEGKSILFYGGGWKDLGSWRENLNLGFICLENPWLTIQHSPQISFHIASGTVRDVLDTLTAGDTNYIWVQDGAAINFIPRRSAGKDVDIVAIMDRKIPHVEIKNLFLSEAIDELGKQINEQNVAAIDVGTTMPNDAERLILDSGKRSDPLTFISISTKDKSIRESLNLLISKHTGAHWIAFPYRGKIRFMGRTNHTHSAYGMPRSKPQGQGRNKRIEKRDDTGDIQQ